MTPRSSSALDLNLAAERFSAALFDWCAAHLTWMFLGGESTAVEEAWTRVVGANAVAAWENEKIAPDVGSGANWDDATCEALLRAVRG